MIKMNGFRLRIWLNSFLPGVHHQWGWCRKNARFPNFELESVIDKATSRQTDGRMDGLKGDFYATNEEPTFMIAGILSN